MAIRIVFLGSKPIGFRCLHFLLEKQQELNIELTGIRTKQRKEFGDGHDLADLAVDYGVPLLSALADIPECEIIYSVQHHELLKAEHIAKANTIAVNLHLAPLPEYRGCNQFSFAIMDDAKEFGATIHAIDRRIDHGEVLFERRFAIPDGCWVDDLYEMTCVAAFELFRDSLGSLLAGTYSRTPQSELLKTRPTSLHYRNEIEDLKRIDLNQSQALIERTVRATYMPGFEPPYAMVGGKKVQFVIRD
jgi:methionyl-tRNA formyltransferase